VTHMTHKRHARQQRTGTTLPVQKSLASGSSVVSCLAAWKSHHTNKADQTIGEKEREREREKERERKREGEIERGRDRKREKERERERERE